jgi:hypothetical protein
MGLGNWQSRFVGKVGLTGTPRKKSDLRTSYSPVHRYVLLPEWMNRQRAINTCNCTTSTGMSYVESDTHG